MTKSIRIRETGGPEVMRWEEVPDAPLGPGDVRVRHAAVGVNYLDTYHRSGLYPLPSLPSGLGVEAAGTVEAVGEAVRGVRPGDRVAYVAPTPGCYAERGRVPADRVVPLPGEIDDRTAAASLLKGMTAEYLIHRCAPVERGWTVLVHAAAGGVGLLLCQWLRAKGVSVVGTVSSRAKAAVAAAHGCTWPVVTAEEDFVARVREVTHGRGVPVAYDSVGKATFLRSLDGLARRGTLVAFGNASGLPEPFDTMWLGRKGSLRLTRPNLFDYTATREELLASAGTLFDAIRAGTLRVEVGRTWPLAEAAEAHRALESRATTGSVLLLP